MYYTKVLLPEIKINKAYFKTSAIKTLLSLGIWNSINQLSVVLLTSLDLLITNICLGAYAGGVYAIAKNVPNLIQSLASVLSPIFVPEFTIMYANNDSQKLKERVNFSVKVMGILITLPIAFLIVNGKEFFSLWVPNENSHLLYQLSLLTIVPMIITGSVNTIFNVYTVTGKLKTPALVLLMSGIFNILVVLLLLETTKLEIFTIPIVSAVVGILRNSIFTPLYAAWCLKVKWYSFYIAILKGVICTATMSIICLGLKYIIPCGNWFIFIGEANIAAIMAIFINFFIVFNKLERADLLNLFLSKMTCWNILHHNK